MKVAQLVKVAHDDEFISIENEDFEVIADGYASALRSDERIEGLTVDEFATGMRFNMWCTVIFIK